MIPKRIWNELDGFDICLGEQGPIKHGYTLDIGYQIARAGYELYYEPNATIYHVHPSDADAIKKKLYNYGKGDTACQMNIFLKYKDFRYFWWSLIGHPVYTIWKIVKFYLGRYAMSPSYLIYGLGGNIVGAYQLLYFKIHNVINRESKHG